LPYFKRTAKIVIMPTTASSCWNLISDTLNLLQFTRQSAVLLSSFCPLLFRVAHPAMGGRVLGSNLSTPTDWRSVSYKYTYWLIFLWFVTKSVTWRPFLSNLLIISNLPTGYISQNSG
jgi:hypothetical protein